VSAATTASATDPADESESAMKKNLLYVSAIVLAAAATVVIMLLRENIATRKEEARQAVFKIIDQNEETIDPVEWGKNFPRQYDSYRRTSEHTGTKYGGGGSEAMAPEKLASDPRLKTIFAGYAFSASKSPCAKRRHAWE
jgi:nitrite reductase (cytochrome c-552)